MALTLDEIEIRVVGSLIEKQITTPEYYPMTLNALTAACNQKSNRDPVVAYDDTTVLKAIDRLREKNIAYVFYGSTSRVPKYKQMFPEVFELNGQELAVMTVLMLRGAQTVGEIRERASRLWDFSGMGEAEETLNNLASREPSPLVVRLPRQPGQKESRYVHLLSGEVDVEALAASFAVQHSAGGRNSESSERIEKLEQQVEFLTTELQSLRQMFEEFKKQFE